MADAHFQIAMIQANNDELEDKYEAAKRELTELRSELAEFKENPPGAIEQPSAPAGELSEQIPQIINFLKELLPPDTKWPKRVMPKLREFLESKED